MNTIYHKEFEKTIKSISNKHQTWRVFSDFCEMSAIAFSNAIIKDEEREARYMEIVKDYTKDEASQIAKLLAITTNALDLEDVDFLGEVFMGLELFNQWKGQFFTPFHLSKVMAGAVVDGSVLDVIKQKGFATVCEPACGAGSTIIGLVSAMKDKGGVNYQEDIHVTAIDIDPTAAHMCFIQLSLLNVPAMVYIGNTISLEMRSVWKTPAHHMGLWDNKLRRGHALGSPQDVFEAAAKQATSGGKERQLTLI